MLYSSNQFLFLLIGGIVMLKIRSIKTKIMGLCIFSVLLTVITIIIILLVQKSSLQKDIVYELDLLAKSETAKIATDVYLMCRAQNESVQAKVDADLNVARDVLRQSGSVSFSEETVSWNAINQYTQTSKSIELPKMMVGNTWLGKNTDPEGDLTCGG